MSDLFISKYTQMHTDARKWVRTQTKFSKMNMWHTISDDKVLIANHWRGLNRQIHKLVFNNEISKTIKRLEGNGVVHIEVQT